jgi:parvulin-like peptidyl-prolyl isomerase
MAKKATTGVPTRRKTDEKDKRTYLSRAEREARAQRWVLISIGAALAVMLIVLLSGIIYEGLIYPNSPVAVVNGQSISTQDFQARVRYTRWQLGQQLSNVAAIYGAQALTDQSSPFYQQYVQLQPGQEYLLGDQVVNQMVDEILVRDQAAEMGITVDAAQVDARIEEYFGYNPNPETATPTLEPSMTPTPIVSPTPSPVPTETPTPEQSPTPSATPLPTVTPAPTLTTEELAQRYADFSENFLNEGADVSGLTRDQIRAIFEAQVLQEQVQEALTADLPDAVEQINSRHILVATEEEAQDVLTALQAGEPFADLARNVSTDSGSAQSGGELGWGTQDTYVAPFADAAFNGEVGAIIGPVQSDFGYHIIQVHAREVRDLTATQIEQRNSDTYNTWLSDLRSSDQTSIEIYDYADKTPSDPTIVDMGLVASQ